jgi:hypothetical protein
MWVYPTTTGAWWLLGKGDAATAAGSQISFYNGATNWDFYYGGSNSLGVAKPTLDVNVWQHIAVVRNTTTITIYKNGTSVSSGSIGANSLNTGGGNPLTIGSYSSAGIVGYISNFRLVKGTAVYTANFTPPTTPLTPVTNTSLLTCQSPSLIDNSANAFAITKAGDVSVQRFSSFSPVTQTPISYSGLFNGSTDYLTWSGTTVGTGAMTFECWFYYTGSFGGIAAFIGPGSAITGGLNCYINTSTSFSFDRYGVAGNNYTVPTIVANTWNHVAFVRDSSNVATVFFNGVRSSTGAVSDTYSYTTTAAVGWCGGAVPRYFAGYISNARLVVGSNVYDPTQSTITVPTTPLTAITNTKLLTCQSDTFIDNSTNAFTITSVGGAIPRAFNPFGYTTTTSSSTYSPIVYGSSAYIATGQSNYLTVAASAALPFTGDFTLELWVYPTSRPNNGTLWSTNSSSIELWMNTSGTISYYTTAATRFTTTLTIPLNAWSHVALVRSSGVAKVYINGLADAASYTSSTSIGAGTEAWYVGRDPGASGGFNGYYSDMRLNNSTAVYKSNFIPTKSPLTAIRGTGLLLNMDKAAITDSTAKNDFETVGDVKLRDETPYAGTYYSNYFDGTGDYLSVASAASLQLDTGNFTIEFWWNGSASGTWTQNIGTLVVNADTGVYRVGTRYNSTNYVYFARGNGTGFEELTYNINVNDGAWHHIACVRTSGVIAMYVDGIARTAATGSTTISGTCTSSNPLVIGYNQRDNAYATGYTSNARIVKGTAVYTSNFTPPTTPLTAIANTSLLTCQSKSFVDNSSNAFEITRNGDVAVKSFNPFRRNTGSSMFFDGTGDYLKGPISSVNQIGSGDYTFECWVFANSLAAAKAGEQTLITYGANGFLISIWTSNVHLAQDNVADKTDWASTAVASGTWFHLAVCRLGASNRCFVNGVQAGSTYTDSTNYTGTTSMYLGANASGTTAFNGYITDLRITKYARYTTTFTPPTSTHKTY